MSDYADRLKAVATALLYAFDQCVKQLQISCRNLGGVKIKIYDQIPFYLAFSLFFLLSLPLPVIVFRLFPIPEEAIGKG